MPKLPTIAVADAEATRIARVLAGKSQSNDAVAFGAVAARWLRDPDHSDELERFIAWYEAQPGPVAMRK